MWSYPALNSRIVSSPPQTANNRSTTIGVSHVTLIARYRSVQSCPICSWRVAVRMRTKAFITSGSLGHKAALHHPSLVFLFTCNQFVYNYSLHMRSFIYILYARAAVPLILSRLLCRAHARACAQRHGHNLNLSLHCWLRQWRRLSIVVPVMLQTLLVRLTVRLLYSENSCTNK